MTQPFKRVMHLLLLTNVLLLSVLTADFASANDDYAMEIYVTANDIYRGGNETLGGIGFRTDEADGWDFQFGIAGEGRTDQGYVEEPLKYWAISHREVTEIKILGGYLALDIGVLHIDDHPMIDHVNYKIGVGLDFGPVEVSCSKVSSAGLHETDEGLDYCGVALAIPL